MKFLAVCGFGVGSSLVLKMTLEKIILEKNLDIEVENTDVTSSKGMTCDAVFTSFELAEDLRGSFGCPIYPIKRYMDREEVKKKVEEFMENSK